MERESLNFGSDEDYKVFCDSCKNIRKEVPAKGSCQECQENYCASCCEIHTKFNITKDHTILKSISDQESKTGTIAKPTRSLESADGVFFPEMCDKHNNEFIKYFCQHCEEVLCTACVTTKHRACSNVQYIPDVVKSKEHGMEVDHINKNIGQMVNELADLKSEIDDNKILVQFDACSAREELEKGIDMIIKYFEDKRAMLTEIIQDIEKENGERISNANSLNRRLSELLQGQKACLTDCTDTDKLIKRFIEAKRSLKRMELGRVELDMVQGANTIRRYRLMPLTCLETAFKNINVGSIEFTDVNCPRKAIHATSLNVRTESESKGCGIADMALLSPDLLAVSDSYNYNVKLLDVPNDKIVSSLVLSSWPLGITRIKADQLAVAQPAISTITIVSISEDGHLTKDRDLLSLKACSGLLYAKGMLFVAYSTVRSQIAVLSLAGDVTRTISTNKSGMPLFSRPCYMAMSIDKDSLYVSDTEIMTITSLSRENTFHVKCDGKGRSKVSGVRGITIDCGGVVYVCGYNSNTVCQLSRECKELIPLLDANNGLRQPRSLAFCAKTNRLFVGLDFGDRIQVFDIRNK
ncbi:tripartite motif-containing protein 45-like [Mya arenaria]|uniref:tripartite motif-containing protein 45-like n=1 Tax=Mya arenaria TaxID=6604 RepID=UPI0022E7A849|nr:tripartite motif-containing protein 45-like [Mya arenaria]